MGKTEPTENLENWTNGKFMSGFPSVDRTSVSAIMNKLKNPCHFVNINCMKKCQITDTPPPKFRSLVFWVLTETEHQCQPLWKNWKMAAISLILIVQKNVKLLTPQKFGSPVFFSECWWKWNIIGKPEMQIFFFWIFHWFIFPLGSISTFMHDYT